MSRPLDPLCSVQEEHVDRQLNVLGSGLQHQVFFRAMEALQGLFEGPLERQPRYVADMGCGDGSLLKEIYQVVKKSKRGRHLEERIMKNHRIEE